MKMSAMRTVAPQARQHDRSRGQCAQVVLSHRMSPIGPSRSSRAEDLAPAEEGSLDPNVLETIQIAGQRVRGQHGHVRDLADLERSKPVLVPGQLMPALRRHAQRFLPREVTFAELAL